MLGYTRHDQLTTTNCTEYYLGQLVNLHHYWVKLGSLAQAIDMVECCLGSIPGFSGTVGELESLVTKSQLLAAIYRDPRSTESNAN